MTFTKRIATLEDIPLIGSLARKTFPETYKNILTKSQTEYMMDIMYSAKSQLEQMTNGHTYYIIYSNESKLPDFPLTDGLAPCGYVSIEDEKKGIFHLQKIYILKQYHGTGAGRFAFEVALSHIRSKHRTPCRMILNVNRNNIHAQEFYTKHGMRKISQGDFNIGDGFFMNDYIFALDIE